MKSTGKKDTWGAGTHKWAMTKRRAGRVVTSFKNTGGSRYTQDRHTNITGLIAQTPS